MWSLQISPNKKDSYIMQAEWNELAPIYIMYEDKCNEWKAF